MTIPTIFGYAFLSSAQDKFESLPNHGPSSFDTYR